MFSCTEKLNVGAGNRDLRTAILGIALILISAFAVLSICALRADYQRRQREAVGLWGASAPHANPSQVSSALTAANTLACL